MGTILTVRVQSEVIKSGFMTINESDFDKKIHKLFKETIVQEPVVEVEEVKSEKKLGLEKKELTIQRSKKMKGVK